ncbi:hypothetical protein [uncultured Tateyamaria sp.]|uniref:hypothetical protein n=1 Tax=uncultured Tateyamaria sp. TaxID=455651 RepID=UPI00261E3C2F|nr:hypothetical protein [uncultured Tateyamaria sp.]
MDFKRPARKSSVFETFLKSSNDGPMLKAAPKKAPPAPSAADMDPRPDPVEVALKHLDASGPTSALKLIKALNIGSTQGLKTLQTMESYGLIIKEETEEGGVIFKRAP